MHEVEGDAFASTARYREQVEWTGRFMCAAFVALAPETSGDIEVAKFRVHIGPVVAQVQGCVRLVSAEMSECVMHETEQVLAQVADT